MKGLTFLCSLQYCIDNILYCVELLADPERKAEISNGDDSVVVLVEDIFEKVLCF